MDGLWVGWGTKRLKVLKSLYIYSLGEFGWCGGSVWEALPNPGSSVPLEKLSRCAPSPFVLLHCLCSCGQLLRLFHHFFVWNISFLVGQYISSWQNNKYIWILWLYLHEFLLYLYSGWKINVTYLMVQEESAFILLATCNPHSTLAALQTRQSPKYSGKRAAGTTLMLMQRYHNFLSNNVSLGHTSYLSHKKIHKICGLNF